MESIEQIFRYICKVRHEQFHSLVVDRLSASGIVIHLDVWELLSQTLLVQVFFGGTRLMLDNIVWHQNVFVAVAFASFH